MFIIFKSTETRKSISGFVDEKVPHTKPVSSGEDNVAAFQTQRPNVTTEDGLKLKLN